jgi:hypothetical protein
MGIKELQLKAQADGTISAPKVHIKIFLLKFIFFLTNEHLSSIFFIRNKMFRLRVF